MTLAADPYREPKRAHVWPRGGTLRANRRKRRGRLPRCARECRLKYWFARHAGESVEIAVAHLLIGIGDPRHFLRAGAEVGRRNVNTGSDHVAS